MKIGIVGNGNAAWHLCKMLQEKGHEIMEIYSRNGEVLSSAPDASYISDPALFSSDCELIFIAVSDNSIQEVSSKINKIFFVVHISGNTPMEVLSQNERGVVWPVQSLIKEKEINYAETPFLIEASDLISEKKLFDLFLLISERTYTADSSKRAVVHLAAVFANNFVNHLYNMADEILLKSDLSFNLLMPMIQSHTEKLKLLSPHDAQTGPAKRDDVSTIANHLQFLEDQPEKKLMYLQLTNSILEKFHGKKL